RRLQTGDGNAIFVNALGFSPDGTLSAAGTPSVYTVDPASGIAERKLTTADQSAGDIAFDDRGTLYLTTSNGFLYEVADPTGSAGPISTLSIGVDNLFGLAYGHDGFLYGFDSNSGVHRIDPNTGQASLIATVQAARNGITGATAYRQATFAAPFVGDPIGSPADTIAMFDPSSGTWDLRGENSPGAPDAGQFAYGNAGW